MQFSANLGFLWTDRPLPDAIRAAHAAGFAAVECHWPYDTNPDLVRAALDATGLPMLGLNTARGDVATGDNGLCANPDRVEEARAAIKEAVAYARHIGAEAIHVMSGRASGQEAEQAFLDNLRYASDQTAPYDITLLIEPLNPFDAPGYFLRDTEHARQIIAAADLPNLKLMFDCYHVARTEGDVVARLRDLLPLIGHVQFAAVPDRGAPDHGDLDYAAVFGALSHLGWSRPLGAEYKPGGRTEDSLGWMTSLV